MVIMVKNASHKTRNTQFKIFLLLALFYAMLIFILSSSSTIGNSKTILDFLHIESIRSFLKPIEHSDLRFLLYPLYIFSEYPAKVGHIVLYAGFGFLLYLTLRNSSNPILIKYAFIFAIIIGTIYGATDEFHQSFVPGRDAGIEDVLIDGSGVTIAQAVIFIKEKLFKRH